MTLIDRFEGRRLEYNDTITYQRAIPGLANLHAPAQPETDTPYTGKVVDFTETSIGVRSDGLYGKEPLYYVFPSALVSLMPRQETPVLNQPRRARGS